MRDWLSRKDWNPEKRWWHERAAEERTKSSLSLVTDEERATMPRELLQRLAHNRWMELRFTGQVKDLEVIVAGDVRGRQVSIHCCIFDTVDPFCSDR